jgi:hypothetical protein
MHGCHLQVATMQLAAQHTSAVHDSRNETCLHIGGGTSTSSTSGGGGTTTSSNSSTCGGGGGDSRVRPLGLAGEFELV